MARTIALLVAANLAAVAGAADGPRPNILLLWLDNVGYGDLGCYGNRENKTPHIDRLAADGVRCTDFYIGSPSCSPSRGALLTGRHPLRNGLNYQLSTGEGGWTEGLPETEKIIPQYLKPLDYATGCFGKWNIGFRPGIRPTERGFGEFIGHMSGNIHYFKYLYHGQNDLRQGTEPIDRRGTYSTDLFADSAIDFIRRHRNQPWLVYLPFNATHYVYPHNVEPGETPQWQVPDKYLALYGSGPAETDQQIRFRAVLTALDDAVGRVLAVVDEFGLRERTMVWCISDNGAFMFPNRGLEVQSNRPLRDGGVTTYEGGVRVPAIARWPVRLKAGAVCREMLSSMDVLPMILAATGAAPPDNRILDGRDPTPTLAGERPSPHEALYWVWGQGPRQQWRGMRQGNYKLVRRADVEPWQLYDLSRDIGEEHDLAAAKPEMMRQLVNRFEAWQQSIANDGTRSLSTRQ
jgi:arylsulfatase A-like enzyme